MEVKKFDDLELYLKGFEIEAIGNKAIRDVQADNKKRGIPLVYSVDGKIYYELADGTVTTNSPFAEFRQYYITNIKTFMEERLFEIQATGIKCDNPSCDFYDDSVKWDDFESMKNTWLNAKCPKCGSVLLTQEDADLMKNIVTLVDNLNKLDTAELKRFSDNIDTGDIDGAIMAHLKTNGDGTLKIEIDDTKKTV